MRTGGQRGFALLVALLAVALVTLSSLVPLQSAARDARRDRETELVFIGRQYRDAIARYHAATPGGQRQYPASLDDLLLDRRFPQPRRHLRRLYADPFTGQADWVLVKSQGRIIGLHSRSDRKPLKERGFPADLARFDNAQKIADWRFMADTAPAAAVVAPSPAEPGPRPEPPAPPRPPAPSVDERRACLFGFQRDITVCMNTPPFDPQCRALARDRFVQCLRR
jgi:type II secretory pathway pseudopilin PulG